MNKRCWLTAMLLTGMVFILIFGLSETSFAAKKGTVTEIISDDSTGVTQEKILGQGPWTWRGQSGLYGKKTGSIL